MVTYELKGTSFLVDVNKCVLREIDDPDNEIPFYAMDNMDTHYEADYIAHQKCLSIIYTGDLTDVERVSIPQMTTLDPEGMAQKYGMKLAQVQGKSDYEVITSQEAYFKRIQGMQPIIEIEEHPFFVSLFSGYLQPKDDFRTMGISIKQLDDFEAPNGMAWVPYDPKRHEIPEVDFDKLFALPTDWVIVEIPFAHELDPYGYARAHGIDEKQMLLTYPLHEYRKARTVPWEESGIQEVIDRNRKAFLEPGEHLKPSSKQQQKPRNR